MVATLADEIIEIVFRYRRSLADAHDYRHFCEQCNIPHIERIATYIAVGKPIHFVLPAFPAKSPNLNKVLGKLPDKGEELALAFLNQLCRDIKSLYDPGAVLTICSDGHVFADVVQVDDADIDRYNDGVGALILHHEFENLRLFGLRDLWDDQNYESRRERLIGTYALSQDEIRTLIKGSPRELAMFNGIERFLIEDYSYLSPGKSRNSIRKMCHELCYEVVRRSHAWSSAVERQFPGAIRLSIHPQPCHYQKLGIYLIESKDNWLTPWHGVPVLRDGSFTLMKRSQALELGASVIEVDGRTSYMTIEVF